MIRNVPVVDFACGVVWRSGAKTAKKANRLSLPLVGTVYLLQSMEVITGKKTGG
jgi:hypothetical protein